jgi:hypothetical protein
MRDEHYYKSPFEDTREFDVEGLTAARERWNYQSR